MKKKNKDEVVVIVYYIDVRNINESELEEFMYRVMDNIQTETIEAEIIAIPIWGETKVECVNPKYIMEEDIIKDHTVKMKEMHEHIDYLIKKEGKKDGQ